MRPDSRGGGETRGLFDVSGLDVLITGATRGIGDMMARGFHDAGARVFICSRSADACARMVASLGDRAVAVPGDTGKLQGCRDIAAGVRGITDRLDVLVNNAGATWGEDLESFPDEAWDKVLAVNLKGPFHLAVACLPMLRAAASDACPARVINVGSVDAMHVPRWESYSYSASKAGLHQLTRHLAKRLAADRITVNAIAPGLVATKMTDFAFEQDTSDELVRSVPLGRTGLPDDMAGAAIFLASPAASWVTGAVLPVDGGFVTLL